MKELMTLNFEHVDLSNSNVLSWKHADNSLEIEIDTAILKSHPLYQKPKQNERAFFLKGLLLFHGIQELKGLKKHESVTPTIDMEGSEDFDTIHGLWKTEEGYYLEGEFGEVSFKSDTPMLKIDAIEYLKEARLLEKL